jgi:hypothetical protein
MIYSVSTQALHPNPFGLSVWGMSFSLNDLLQYPQRFVISSSKSEGSVSSDSSMFPSEEVSSSSSVTISAGCDSRMIDSFDLFSSIFAFGSFFFVKIFL